MLGCQILCVLRACPISTDKTYYTQKTALAVVFWTEAAMSSVSAERKEAGMLCSVPTLRLRSSNPPPGRRKLLCSEGESSLSVAREKGTQDQPSTRKQRSRYTKECNAIKSSCKFSSGQRRGSAVSSASGTSVQLR